MRVRIPPLAPKLTQMIHILKNPNETYCLAPSLSFIRVEHYTSSNELIQDHINRLRELPVTLCPNCEMAVKNEQAKSR